MAGLGTEKLEAIYIFIFWLNFYGVRSNFVLIGLLIGHSSSFPVLSGIVFKTEQIISEPLEGLWWSL